MAIELQQANHEDPRRMSWPSELSWPSSIVAVEKI